MPRSIKETRVDPQQPDEEMPIRIWEGLKFSFNPETLQFILGEQNNQHLLSISEFQDYKIRSKIQLDEKTSVTPDDKRFLHLIISGGLVELPSFRRKISELAVDTNTTIEITNQVEEVMRKVYKKVEPQTVLPRKSKTGRSRNWMEFAASIDTNGVFRLQTFGNCSCMGHDPTTHGVFVPERNPSISNLAIPLAYGYHNVDSRAQLLSLYAGAGTLAHLASRK